MLPTQRSELLHSICSLMPAIDRIRIQGMDPEDYMAFTEAYCALRESAALTPALRQELVEAICELMDLETEQMMRAKAWSTSTLSGSASPTG